MNFQRKLKIISQKKAVETTLSLVAHQTQVFTWTLLTNQPVSNKINSWQITVAHILLITSHSSKKNISKLENKNVTLKQEKYSQGQRTLKMPLFMDNYNWILKTYHTLSKAI